MGRKSLGAKLGLAAMTMAIAVHPALADVQKGVEAWSRGEYEGAIKEWRPLALKGDPDAQYNMGHAYKVGRGVKADLNVALDWYRRAMEQGHLAAADSYGQVLHYQGKVSEALPYLEASASRGDEKSQYLLATELFNGVNIAKDWVRAYALMTRASSAGMGYASRSLAQMDQYIPLEQRQQAVVLAGQLEQQESKTRATQVAGFPINTKPPVASGKQVSVPPSKTPPASTPGFPSNIPVAPVRSQTSVPPASTRPKPLPPVVNPTTVRTVADGGWRIQLGAFGDEGNAQKLWNSLEARVKELAGLQPYLKAAGNVTRLQAGPFTSRATADAMCAKVKATGKACIAVQK